MSTLVSLSTHLSASQGASYSNQRLLRKAIQSAFYMAGFGQDVARGFVENIITPGMSVLLKPNWVHHENIGGSCMDSLITHPEFVLAVLQELVAAGAGRIIVGDAPIQNCHWSRIVTSDFQSRAAEAAGDVPVEFVDFRRAALRSEYIEDGVDIDRRDALHYVLFDLGSESLLESVSGRADRFRVTNYDPRKLRERHARGRHQYLLCKEAFEVDCVVWLPKLKTHRKAGLTCALKNLVGINGDKDFLPHHSLGGTAEGGDCYPGFDLIRRAAEWCVDRANQRLNDRHAYLRWRSYADKLLRWNSQLGRPTDIEGSWFGNDTCWRMVLDLNRLFFYGSSEGFLHRTRQRNSIYIVDAVVAGQGEGPLLSEPLELGYVLAGQDPACIDWVGALLLGMDPERIPLLQHAFDKDLLPITDAKPEGIRVVTEDSTLSSKEAGCRYAKAARLPSGWEASRPKQAVDFPT